jgi:uncharacterized protein YbjT (DUF2867 family)
MARCLIIACGCRGRALARELHERGHAVRGTTRDPGKLAVIEAAGADPWLGDPDRVATLARALEQVTIACVLLGSAAGPEHEVASLHGSRLEMLMQRILDTTVRGVLYEAAGTVEQVILERGARTVRAVCVESRIPYALLEADPTEPAAWLAAASGAIESLLSGAVRPR